DRTLSIQPVPDPGAALMVPKTGTHVSLGPPREGPLGIGRRLFFSSGDHRVSADGRACASCHPDGRDDGLVWRTPDGPRQTPMLAGRVVDTAPFGWTRADPDLQAYIAGTIERLRGGGLAAPEKDALALYVRSLKTPVSRVSGDPAPVLARGS